MQDLQNQAIRVAQSKRDVLNQYATSAITLQAELQSTFVDCNPLASFFFHAISGDYEHVPTTTEAAIGTSTIAALDSVIATGKLDKIVEFLIHSEEQVMGSYRAITAAQERLTRSAQQAEVDTTIVKDVSFTILAALALVYAGGAAAGVEALTGIAAADGAIATGGTTLLKELSTETGNAITHGIGSFDLGNVIAESTLAALCGAAAGQFNSMILDSSLVPGLAAKIPNWLPEASSVPAQELAKLFLKWSVAEPGASLLRKGMEDVARIVFTEEMTWEKYWDSLGSEWEAYGEKRIFLIWAREVAAIAF